VPVLHAMMPTMMKGDAAMPSKAALQELMLILLQWYAVATKLRLLILPQHIAPLRWDAWTRMKIPCVAWPRPSVTLTLVARDSSARQLQRVSIVPVLHAITAIKGHAVIRLRRVRSFLLVMIRSFL
jgi:hypothetical protein